MEERRLWMRLGVSFSITEAEEAIIFGEDTAKAEELLRRLVAEDRFVVDGDTYIPGVTVEEDGETEYDL